MTCAENGSLEMAQRLVDKGADVNAQMSTGWTALHTAAKHGHAHILKMLLENNGDPHLVACHRDIGNGLKVKDVTRDENILILLPC